MPPQIIGLKVKSLIIKLHFLVNILALVCLIIMVSYRYIPLFDIVSYRLVGTVTDLLQATKVATHVGKVFWRRKFDYKGLMQSGFVQCRYLRIL